MLPLKTPYELRADMSAASVVLPSDSAWPAASTPVTLSTLALSDATRSDTEPPRKVSRDPNVLLSAAGSDTCTTKAAGCARDR